MMVFLGALVICFGIVGIIYKVWTNQISNLQKARSRERIRQQELALVKAQNLKYQQRLGDLETRINTIQALQNSRIGPVEMMVALGNVVDRVSDIYLYTMNPEGERLQLKGQSSTAESMASFLAYLKRSAFRDVQLEQFYEDDQHDRLTYKFTLNCLFNSPTAVSEPAAPAGPGTPPPHGPGMPQGLRGQQVPRQGL
jgi:Tfp pilus assembly protein PilN